MTRFSLLSILAVPVFFLGCQTRNTSTAPKGDPSIANNSAPVPDDTPASTVLGPVAQPAPAPVPDTRPLLVCFGDSLTAGFGTNPGQSYPDFLQADLDQVGYRYRVVNEGVSGATSKDGVARLAAVVALKPQVVVVEFGGNDGLRGLPVPAMQANLDRMVGALQKAGAKVLLAGIILPPSYGQDYVAAFVGAYTNIADKYHAPLYPFLLKDVYGAVGLMQADNIHATARGNQIVAQNLLPSLTPLLKK